MSNSPDLKTYNLPPALIALLAAYGPALVALAKQGADAAIDALAARLGIQSTIKSQSDTTAVDQLAELREIVNAVKAMNAGDR